MKMCNWNVSFANKSSVHLIHTMIIDEFRIKLGFQSISMTYEEVWKFNVN